MESFQPEANSSFDCLTASQQSEINNHLRSVLEETLSENLMLRNRLREKDKEIAELTDTIFELEAELEADAEDDNDSDLDDELLCTFAKQSNDFDEKCFAIDYLSVASQSPGFKMISVINNINSLYSKYIPFKYNSKNIGLIREDFIPLFRNEAFEFNETSVTFSKLLHTEDLKSEAVAKFLNTLKEKRFFALDGWRNELYAVKVDGELIVKVERGGIGLFGFTSYGCHINCFKRVNNEILMWIGKRADDKDLYPGYLDQMAAGGLADSITIHQTVVKECYEEANVPMELAQTAKFVSTISYVSEIPQVGIVPEVQYIFDLIVPDDFVPVNNDKEVQAFYLWDMNKIIEELDKFKPNCAAVIIDFCIRHGFMNPEDSDFLKIFNGLHVNLDSFFNKI